jgi:FAD/FMN-containing dehydrogenase
LFPDRRFESALSETFEGLEARCHWGKHLALSRNHLRHQYPHWEAFWTMRDQMDPERVFENDFTRSLTS